MLLTQEFLDLDDTYPDGRSTGRSKEYKKWWSQIPHERCTFCGNALELPAVVVPMSAPDGITLVMHPECGERVCHPGWLEEGSVT